MSHSWWVVAPDQARLVSTLPDHTVLSPGFAVFHDDPQPGDLFIITSRAFREGPWSGLDLATGTALCAELLQGIDCAKSAGASTVLWNTLDTPGVNLNSVVSAVDHVFEVDFHSLEQPQVIEILQGTFPKVRRL